MDEARRHLWSLRLLHGAIVASVGLVGVIAWTGAEGARQGGPRASAPLAASEVLPWTFGAALALAVAIPLVRRRLLPRRSHDRLRRIGRYYAAQVVSWGLADGIAASGAVAALATHEPRLYLPFAFAAIVNLLLFRPRADEVRTLLAPR